MNDERWYKNLNTVNNTFFAFNTKNALMRKSYNTAQKNEAVTIRRTRTRDLRQVKSCFNQSPR